MNDKRPTVLDVLGTSTPVSETLAQKLGYVKAAIACRVFFYEQLEQRVCNASIETLAQKLGMSTGCVSTNLKWLLDSGYIEELGKHNKGNHTNSYRVTRIFYQALQPSPDEGNVHEMNDNVHEMNGEEELKEELKNTLSLENSPTSPEPQAAEPIMDNPLTYQEYLQDRNTLDCRFSDECRGSRMEFCQCYQDYLREYEQEAEHSQKFMLFDPAGKPIAEQCKKDYLSHIVAAAQRGVSEATGPNPEDQWLVYRDEFIAAYAAHLQGRYLSDAQKGDIADYMQKYPNDTPNDFRRVLEECRHNWSGRGSCTWARILEVRAAGGTWKQWKQSEYPKEQRNGQQPGATPATNKDAEAIRTALAKRSRAAQGTGDPARHAPVR